jgi:hypothetical protein
MSSATKPAGASEKVKVTVVEFPAVKEAGAASIASVGTTVSSVNVSVVLLAVLPAASVSVTTTVWLPSAVGAV